MDWSNAPEVVQFLRYPATSSVIGLCCLIWLYIWRNGIDYGHVGSSYRLVTIQGIYWRAITASFSHISIVHLGFNMLSTYQLRVIEQSLGVLEYFRLTFIFLILSICMQQTLHSILARTRWGEVSQNTIGVGYSCVVFALMTFASVRGGQESLDLIFFKVPFSVSPFMSLIMTQMIIPHVDFVGHLSGILAGYLVCWGFFDWLQGFYWLLQTVVWCLILCVFSLKRSGIDIPGVKSETLSSAEEAAALTHSSLVGQRIRQPWV